jgi:hypothetical protein
MALTNDILRGNATLASLTDEQITAIVQMSQNDENTVIGQRIGEIYGGLDADILAASGEAKNGTEKTYEYAKRVIGGLKGRADASANLQAQVDSLTAEKTRLEGIIAKGGNDAEVKAQLTQAQADLARVQTEYAALNTKYTEAEKNHASELMSMRMQGEFDKAGAKVKFRADLPQAATEVLMRQAVERVKGFNPQFIDDGKGGKVLAFTDANKAILRNPATNLMPYTAAELVEKELDAMGVLDKGRKQTGAGSDPNAGAGAGGSSDIGGARTQTEAYDIISKSLLAKGLTVGSKEFDEEMQKAWKDNNVKSLPLK